MMEQLFRETCGHTSRKWRNYSTSGHIPQMRAATKKRSRRVEVLSYSQEPCKRGEEFQKNDVLEETNSPLQIGLP